MNTEADIPSLPLISRLEVPELINNLPVIAVVSLPHDRGELPIAVVICNDEHRRQMGTAWVTWYWVHSETGGYATEGYYCTTYAAALRELGRRANRYADYTAGGTF